MKKPDVMVLGFMISALLIMMLASNLMAQETGDSNIPDPGQIELPSADLLSGIQFENAEEEEPSIFEDLHPIWYFHTENNLLRKDHPLNPEAALLDFTEREAYTAIDLDWNPQLNDTLSIRSRVVGQYKAEDNDLQSHGYFLEGYLQWQNSAKTITLDAGKEKIGWGSGYAWNPVQVMIPLKKDVSDDFEEDEGIEMVKLELALGNLTVTALIARLNRDNTGKDNPYQGAAKVSMAFEPWEVSVIHHQATNYGWKNGLSFSGLWSDSLELHGEWARSELRDRYSAQLQAEGIQMGPDYLPARYDYTGIDKSRNYDQFLIGGQVTFLSKMNLIFEYFKTTHGYDDKEWELIKKGIRESLIDDAWNKTNYPFTTSAGNPYAGFLKNTMKKVSNEELRQNYLFFRYTSGESTNMWEWEQIALINLDDTSQIHRAVLHKTWKELVKTSLSLTLFRGDSYSEFGLNPYTEMLEFDVEVRF